jgi:hypothetical protein
MTKKRKKATVSSNVIVQSQQVEQEQMQTKLDRETIASLQAEGMSLERAKEEIAERMRRVAEQQMQQQMQ